MTSSRLLVPGSSSTDMEAMTLNSDQSAFTAHRSRRCCSCLTQELVSGQRVGRTTSNAVEVGGGQQGHLLMVDVLVQNSVSQAEAEDLRGRNVDP